MEDHLSFPFFSWVICNLPGCMSIIITLFPSNAGTFGLPRLDLPSYSSGFKPEKPTGGALEDGTPWKSRKAFPFFWGSGWFVDELVHHFFRLKVTFYIQEKGTIFSLQKNAGVADFQGMLMPKHFEKPAR